MRRREVKMDARRNGARFAGRRLLLLGMALGTAVAVAPPSTAIVADGRASTRMISLTTLGFQLNNDSGVYSLAGQTSDNQVGLTPDGRYVVFTSRATNVDASAPFFASLSDGQQEVYLRDRDADGDAVFDEPGQATLKIVSLGNLGNRGNGPSMFPAINAGTAQVAAGRYVAFLSEASDFVVETDIKYLVIHTGHDLDPGPAVDLHKHVVTARGNGMSDIFVRDRDADGNGVFDEGCPGCMATTRASVGSAGQQAEFPHPPDLGPVNNNDECPGPLCATPDPSTQPDAYLNYCSANLCETPMTGTNVVSAPSISADGRYVGFYSYAPMAPNDTNTCGPAQDHPDACGDLYVWDRTTGASTLLSINGSGVSGDDNTGLDPIPFAPNQQAPVMARPPAISGDGNLVAFQSFASDLVPGDTNLVQDVFLVNRSAGTLTRISRNTSGAQIFGASSNPAISRNGSWVVFESVGLIVAGDSSGVDLYAYSTALGTIVDRVNRNSGNATSNGSIRGSVVNAFLSGSGRFIGFQSSSQVYVRDRDADSNGIYDEVGVGKTVTRIASVSSEGISGQSMGSFSSGASRGVAVSDDGLNAAFISSAANLVIPDTNLCGTFNAPGGIPLPNSMPRTCNDVFVRVLSNLAPFATAGSGLGVCIDALATPGTCPFSDRV